MKKAGTMFAAVTLAAVLGACQSDVRTVATVEDQRGVLDLGTKIDEGVGSTTHRVIQDGNGKTLFEYTAEVAGFNPDGSYHILLKPAGKGPTFAATRDVSMLEHDKARVELMSDPATGRKIVDHISLMKHQTIGSHLMALHNHIYHWVHGD
jgi:hypothetical protein